MLSIELPISLTPFLAKASAWFAKPTNSVVHTGVKSAGWLKRITHCPLAHWLNLIGPCVVLASKSGALSPRRRGACCVDGAFAVASVMVASSGVCGGAIIATGEGSRPREGAGPQAQ